MTKRKTIGIIIQYYNFRNDMRSLVELLAMDYDLKLYVDAKEKIDKNKLPENAEQIILKSYKSTLKNKVWNTLYRFFCNRPTSRENNLKWVKRRFGSSKKAKANYIELISAYLGYYFPDWIDFDMYCKHLSYNKTNTEGVDVFLSFTDVNDVYFTAQLLNENKKLLTYIYSWDHAAKYHKISKENIQYLTWNEEIKKDIIYQHQVNPKNIEIVGSSQLSLLQKYLELEEKPHNPHAGLDYIYFGASAGYKAVAKQEIKYVEYLAKEMKRIMPTKTLLFRPYPLLTDWTLYEPLEKIGNVVFDNYGGKDSDVVFTRDDINTKFQKMSDAKAIFHCGSTFGMEACYFNVPVFYMRFNNFPFKQRIAKSNDIRNFIYQYHLEKYLDLGAYENVVKEHGDLEGVLMKLEKGKEDELLAYSKQVANYTPLMNMESFKGKLETYL